MDKVITANGKSVTVSTHLPYGELRIGNLATCGNGCSSSMNGIHTIRIHIVG